MTEIKINNMIVGYKMKTSRKRIKNWNCKIKNKIINKTKINCQILK